MQKIYLFQPIQNNGNYFEVYKYICISAITQNVFSQNTVDCFMNLTVSSDNFIAGIASQF
ncbi:hypothetical protein CS542_05230 [Pedobacter sp. IW39]|nr:hypothetical protein CS542_05230 [Pedobacter sp. IW39]